MDIYKCKKCGERFLSCDLVRTKCSENECGAFMLTFCPKCFGKIEKEQEAVAPTWQQGKAYCGSCGKRIPLKIGARYCHKCGKPILWEGR